MIKQTLLGLTLVTSCSLAQALPVVQFSDFINDSLRSNFNGFESIPTDGLHYTGGNSAYTEDGITVQQINGDAGNDIWVTYNSTHQQDQRSWYPDGGDHGYTQISLSSGLNFEDVGMRIGSGFGLASNVFYELLNDGVSVLSGFFAPTTNQYLGFSGGGFDKVLLSDCSGCSSLTTSVTDGRFQALALDSIEVSGSVPEPTSLALLAAGLVGLGWRKRKSLNNTALVSA